MKKKPFTLLELSAAMAVLMIFMLFIMRFFNTSQDVMNRSVSKVDQYEQARVVMDMLANDLQNIYYSEGVDQTAYFQTDSSGNTQDLSFPAVRPQTFEATKTDLSWVTYHFDADSCTLKMGVAGDDQTSKWGSHLTGNDLGLLAEGVFHFAVVPHEKGGTVIGSPATMKNGPGRRIPDYVRIELQLMDGDTAAAIKHFKKTSTGTLPKTLDPSDDAFAGKDKLRSFFRIVEIDRGQY